MSAIINDSNRDVVLAALRWFQHTRKTHDTSVVNDIADPDEASDSLIDHICEAINIPDAGSGIESYSVLVTSTGHMTQEDSQHLQGEVDTQGENYRIWPTGYGWVVRLHPDMYQNDLGDLGLSDAIWNVFYFALARGYGAVEFDRDGEFVEGLETFDW